MSTFNEEIQRLNQAKSDIKKAIEEKGVLVGDGLIDGYASKIREIKERGKTQVKTATVTKNNTSTTVRPDDGYVGLDRVVVKTEIPMGSKTVDIDMNGQYGITPDDGYEGMDYVEVNVNIPIQDSKDVEYTNNGSYSVVVDDGFEGLKKVNVDVNLPIQSRKSINITENGSYSVSKDADYVGLNKVAIYVDIPIQEEKELLIKSKGTYTITPDDGYKGLKKGTVVVDVKEDTGKTKLPNGICLSGSTWETFDMNDYDWSLVYDCGEMFMNCENAKTITLAPIKPFSAYQMFRYCNSLTEIKGIEDLDVSNVIYMNYMFGDCYNITSLDLSKWDTSKVTSMLMMFSYCNKLNEIKMGGDVSNVTDVSSMFPTGVRDGKFYYNDKYDYSKIIAVLPVGWTAIPMTITD